MPEAVTFARKSAVLRGGAQAKLTPLLKALTANPTTRIVLEGHSSADGSAEFNQSLSEQRAQTVKNWLVKHGIAAERIEVRGLGASQPKTEGDTEAARSANRRVEFKAAE